MSAPPLLPLGAGVNGLEAGQTFIVSCAVLFHNLYELGGYAGTVPAGDCRQRGMPVLPRQAVAARLSRPGLLGAGGGCKAAPAGAAAGW